MEEREHTNSVPRKTIAYSSSSITSKKCHHTSFNEKNIYFSKKKLQFRPCIDLSRNPSV
jgi:hypothetical protein